MNVRIIGITAAVIFVLGLGLTVAGKIKTGPRQLTANAPAPVSQLLQEAAALENEGQKINAKEAYAKIVSEYPDYDHVDQIKDKLGALNMELIMSNAPLPQTILHQVIPGDSLGKLAKTYGTTVELIKKGNGLKSDVIRTGQKLRIWKAPFSVFVDKSQNILLLKSGEDLIKEYRVSTGANNITPVGTFRIATKLVKPVWFKPGSAPVPAESPENVLGTRWMGFDTDPHYGIHGTTEPEKIGQQVTAGCVRMRNEDVEQLYDFLPIGTTVTIQD